MSNITEALYSMRLMDDLARKETFIHKIHSLVKLLTTLAYLTAVVSFDRFEIGGLMTLFFYPVVVFTLAELPLKPILKRILFVEPFIIGIGILNPLFDHQTVILSGIVVSRGWITFISILIKCGLTVTAALLLLATTGMDRLASALRALKIPRLFVLQLMLTYRYVSVLLEEVGRILNAYSLRAPGQKGIHWKSWGSLAGQLILRTFERAQAVYQAMCLRGFDGEYHMGNSAGIKASDFIYLAIWVLFFAAARFLDIPGLIGLIVTGGIE